MVKKWFNKWKKEPKFRRNVIIGIIVFLFIMNARGDIETQAFKDPSFCDDFADGLGFFDTECVSNGCVFDKYPDGLSLNCKSCIPTGTKIFMSDVYDAYPSKWGASQICCSGNWLILSDTEDGVFGEQYGAICKAATDPDISPPLGGACKESWQRTFAQFMKFDFARGMDCTTKAYIVIAFLIFAALAVI